MIHCDDATKKDDDCQMRDVVNVRKLDEFLNDIPDDWYIGAMKLDIEGMEELAIRGALEFLSKHQVPYIIIEFQQKHLTRLNLSPEVAFKFYQDLGYTWHKHGFEGEVAANIEQLFKKSTANMKERDYFLTLNSSII